MSFASTAGRQSGLLVWSCAVFLAMMTSLASATEVFASTDVPKDASGASTTSKLTINSSGRLIVGKISVSLYIPHERTLYLRLSLIAPDGVTKIYLTREVVSGSYYTSTGDYNYGSTSTGFGLGSDYSKRVFFDDGATTPAWTQQTAVIPPGSYIPYDGELADLCNRPADGTWTLMVEDLLPLYYAGGSLVAWSLHIEPKLEHIWTGSGGDRFWSNANNWQDGNAPISGEGAAFLRFPAMAAGALPLLNDIKGKLTISDLWLGGNVTLSGNDAKCEVVLANNAVVHSEGDNTIIKTTSNVFVRPNGRPYVSWGNYYGGYYSGPIAAMELRGLATFNVSLGTLTIAGALNDYITDWYRQGNGRYIGGYDSYYAYLYSMPRKEGVVKKRLDGTLVLTGDNMYTGLTTINGGVLSIKRSTGLGTFYYNDGNGNFIITDGGTVVDGGTLELDLQNITGGSYYDFYTQTYVNVTGQRAELFINDASAYDNISENALTLSGLGYNETGALRVPSGRTVGVAGKISLQYVTGAAQSEQNDIMNPNAVAFGVMPGGVLNYGNLTDKPGSFIGQTLPIRTLGGGSFNWGVPVPSHFLTSDVGTVCTMVNPNLIPDAATVGVMKGGHLTFNVYDPDAAAHPDNSTLKYVDKVGDVVMAGGIMDIALNGVLKINSNQIKTLGWQTQTSTVVGALEMGASPSFNTEKAVTLSQHLILGSAILSPINTSPLVNASQVNKLGKGNLTLEKSCVFSGIGQVSAGGLVVNNNIRSVVNGAVLGRVNVDGDSAFVGGIGTVAGISAKNGGVNPGMPMLEMETGVAGTLNCDWVDFTTKKSWFSVDLYDGTCDKLVVGTSTTSTQAGDVILGDQNNGSPYLRPVWRGTTDPTGAWYFIVNTRPVTKSPILIFHGIPRSSNFVNYTVFDPDQMYPDAAQTPNDIRIKITGTVRFKEASDHFAEVNADGSPVIAKLELVTSGTGKVSFGTEDETAIQGIDYVPSSGEMALQLNTATSVEVPIIYTQTIKDSRTFSAILIAPSDGLAVRAPTVMTVRIDDINEPEDKKSTGCGMSSGYAVFLLFAFGLLRLTVLRRRES